MGKNKNRRASQRAPDMAGSESMLRFLDHHRLPPDELVDWEHDIRQQLLDILTFLREPLPLIDWIDNRIGGEIETLKDSSGSILIRLRGQEPPPPPRGQEPPPPPRVPMQPFRQAPHTAHQDPPVNMSAAERENRERKKQDWLDKLPADQFQPSELKLRDAIFEFLARWSQPKQATLADLLCDDQVGKVKSFLPKYLPMRDWIERRMGAEIIFQPDGRGNECLDVSDVGKEYVDDMFNELSEGRGPQSGRQKRKAETGFFEERFPKKGGTPKKGPCYDPVSSLYNCLQSRFRSIEPKFKPSDNVKYEISQDGDIHLVTCNLLCFGGQRFTGESRSSHKEAKVDAAERALLELFPEQAESELRKKQNVGAAAI